MKSVNADSFFERVSKELTRRKSRQYLLLDKGLTFHIPARALARYDLHAGIEGFWNVEYGAFAFVFVKKPDADARVDDFPEGETWPLDAGPFIADYENEIRPGLGKLPARFGYIIESPDGGLEGYSGRGDEAIIVLLQWRQH